MNPKKVEIREPGTVFRVGNTDITLKDHGCIWGMNNTAYFTKKGWKEYQEKRDELSSKIDTLREE